MNKELRWIPSVALVFLLFLKGAVRGTAEREDLRGWMIVWGSWGGGSVKTRALAEGFTGWCCRGR